MTVPFFPVVIFPVVVGVHILTCISTNSQTTVPFFPVVIFSGDSWCLSFETTDGYLRFTPTNGQTTVPFFPVVIFSGCNLIDKETHQKT